MDLGLGGVRVLVTAGAGGIGREVALGFVREGARVHVCDLDAEALAALAGTEPAITGEVCDVADRGAVGRVVASAAAALGGLDVLVNNAGIAGPTGPVEEIDPAAWDRCLAVCLTSQFEFARLCVPLLRRAGGGSIVNLSSAAGRLGFPLRSPYAAAKWGVIGLTKSLAVELGPAAIRVNAILPGIVEGERIRRVFADKGRARGVPAAQVEAEALAGVSLGAMVTPQQIADQILFLASERGRTITGQAISVCGDTRILA